MPAARRGSRAARHGREVSKDEGWGSSRRHLPTLGNLRHREPSTTSMKLPGSLDRGLSKVVAGAAGGTAVQGRIVPAGTPAFARYRAYNSDNAPFYSFLFDTIAQRCRDGRGATLRTELQL